ncbi:MAG: type II toxin-antitoxin system VapC family toxin [Nanoarchaeota archaeon]
MKLYLDTNIFLDAILDRKNLSNRDLSNSANSLFLQAISCKHHIIISSWTLKELSNHITPNRGIFSLLKPKIIKVIHDEEDLIKAKNLSKGDADDALHVVLAEKSGAESIVTRNLKHFLKIETQIPISLPEEIISQNH